MKSKALFSSIVGTGLALSVAISIPAAAQAADLGVQAGVKAQVAPGALNGHRPGPGRPGGPGERGSSTQMGQMGGQFRGGPNASSTDAMRMRIKPAAVGKITSISGSTFVVESQKGFGSSTTQMSYTVDASSALIKKGNATSTLSDLVVGDSVFVEGTANGTTVSATVVHSGAIKMGQGRMGQNGAGPTDSNQSKPASKGFLGSIKSFFGKIFGF